MRAIEFLTEVRNRMYQYIKSIVPTWPDYIVKDWLYPGFRRYNDKTKRELLTMLNREGLNRNTQWQLVPNMKFTMDIWTSHTLKKLQGRAGGLSDMGMDIPRDAERHATQARLAQQQGGIRSEPVILIKRPDGYELLEGWHRTIQHFHKFPDGYTGPAYIAVSRGQQGVAEGLQEINWVKPNFDFEWHEVEEQSRMKQVPVDVRQYYQKHFPNKDTWLKAVQNGKAVVVPPDHAYEIRNAPFDKASLQKVLAPTGHEGPIGPAKEKRVNDLFDKGQVEMPIILKTSQGLWLIGGKTRLGTANYVKGLPAKVWLIGGEQGVAEGFLNESAYEEAWELISQPVPEIQQFVKQLGLAQDDTTAKQIAPMIDATPDTQLPAASIPKLKNLANKGNDVQTLKAIQQISGRPDAAQQYAKIMQSRDAGEGRQRGYDVSGLINSVKSGNYEAPVLLKLATGTYVIGGRTRLYAALALGIPAKVKIISVSTFAKQGQQGVAEGISNDMSTEDMISYLRQHHDTNLHQDYLNHVNTFSKFVLKDIPTNTLKTDLPGLDREKVERYKKMDQSKAPPIVLGGKYILDGYHRANAVKELGIPTIKAYVGITTK